MMQEVEACLKLKPERVSFLASRRQGCPSRLEPRASKVIFLGKTTPYLFSSSDLKEHPASGLKRTNQIISFGKTRHLIKRR
jgi:hypothetical protein